VTALLISVKNSEEALIALDAGVDIIDLKDPNTGALGALNLAVTKDIVHLVNGRTLVSATVGEQHVSVGELLADIHLRAAVGVDIIKIAVSELIQAADFFDELAKITKTGIKIVAVFFADEALDLSLLSALKNAGFYGAMLDTKNKHLHLLHAQNLNTLHLFTQRCHQCQLKSGLAGSLQAQHIDLLLKINPTYIGFRGGVCENSQRKSALSGSKLIELVTMLRNGNKSRTKAQLILSLALHS
jgi:(5-formylfuran-3-yl)methyl phosphate synthase